MKKSPITEYSDYFYNISSCITLLLDLPFQFMYRQCYFPFSSTVSFLLKDLVGFNPLVVAVDVDNNELAQFEVLCRVGFLEHKRGASKL